jgi:exonuclease SbcC
VSSLKEEIGLLKAKEREIEAALKEGSRRLHSIEIKAKELGVLEESPPCRTTQELDNVAGLIKEYVNRIELNKRTAQDAIRIFENIDAEEKTRVSDLFGPGSSVSSHMRSITGGRYSEACYDLDKNAVYLVDGGNERVPARSLSGGAYDQLYLSIRLSIAERLLAEEKGFLLLDDPFVKADYNRLSKMMTILKRQADEGWQIIYFSAKAEVAEVLEEDINAGRISLLQLDALDRDATAAGEGPSELFD